MTPDQIYELILSDLVPKIEAHAGLSVFARERAKFEGWFKVELLSTLTKKCKDVVPEKDRVDICLEDWAIELKTVNTNITYPGVKTKTRPITRNTDAVIKDIEKLKRLKTRNSAVSFIVFPIEPDNKDWAVQLNRIKLHTKEMRSHPFKFSTGIPAVLYFALV
jgi:hypothetical protein